MSIVDCNMDGVRIQITTFPNAGMSIVLVVLSEGSRPLTASQIYTAIHRKAQNISVSMKTLHTILHSMRSRGLIEISSDFQAVNCGRGRPPGGHILTFDGEYLCNSVKQFGAEISAKA